MGHHSSDVRQPGLPLSTMQNVSFEGHLVTSGPILTEHPRRCLQHPASYEEMVRPCLSLFPEAVLTQSSLEGKRVLLPIPGYSRDGWGSQGRALKLLVPSYPAGQSG